METLEANQAKENEMDLQERLERDLAVDPDKGMGKWVDARKLAEEKGTTVSAILDVVDNSFRPTRLEKQLGIKGNIEIRVVMKAKRNWVQPTKAAMTASQYD